MAEGVLSLNHSPGTHSWEEKTDAERSEGELCRGDRYEGGDPWISTNPGKEDQFVYEVFFPCPAFLVLLFSPHVCFKAAWEELL